MFNRALRCVGLGCALAVFATPSAFAQLVNGKWQAPPKSGSAGATAPRQGTEVRPEDGTAKSKANKDGVVPLRVIPAVLMSDGSIMADFGSGLEVVGRACPNSAANMPLRIVAGGASNTQPVPQLQPAPGMQAAPAQATASQQMSQSHTPSAPAQSSCHLRQSGRVFVTR